MPVLKATRSPTLLKDAIVLDLGDVAGQAVRLREAARRQAEVILNEAKHKAASLTEKGEEEGFAKGHAAGLTRGTAEGRERGRAEAMHDVVGVMEEVRESLAGVVERIESDHREAVEAAESQLIRLALRIAERVIGRAVNADPALAVAAAADALATVMRPLEVTLRVHPEDEPLLEAAMPDLLERLTHLQHVHLKPDGTLQRGGCIATFGQGETDATIDSKLDRIAATLLPDEERPPMHKDKTG